MRLETGQTIITDTGSHQVLSSSPVLFTTQAEMREQLLSVTRTAEHHLTLWSRDLNSGLFETAGFLDVLKRFLLVRRHPRVKLLTTPFNEHDRKHPLLLMAERLPHSFEVRTCENTHLESAELLLADERGVLYRIHADRWDGMADIYDPQVTRFYGVQFDKAWCAAQLLPSNDQVINQ